MARSSAVARDVDADVPDEPSGIAVLRLAAWQARPAEDCLVAKLGCRGRQPAEDGGQRAAGAVHLRRRVAKPEFRRAVGRSGSAAACRASDSRAAAPVPTRVPRPLAMSAARMAMARFCSSDSASSHGKPSQRAMMSSHRPGRRPRMDVTAHARDARVERLGGGFEHADQRAQETAGLCLGAPIDRRQVLHQALAGIEHRQLQKAGNPPAGRGDQSDADPQISLAHVEEGRGQRHGSSVRAVSSP